MSNYLKTTDFAAKDSLPSGDSNKIIRGSEFETEFDNISTAIATKADANNPALTGSGTANNLSVTGTLTAATVDINSGAIDGTTVGSTSASSGAFTTLSASGALTGTTASFSGDLAVDTDTLFVNATSSRVGIGTITPVAQLEVNATTSASVRIGNTVGQDLVLTGGSSGVSMGTENVLPMTFSTSNTERMRINPSGNVGIGTTSPTSKLQVTAGSVDAVSADVSGVVSEIRLGSTTTGQGNAYTKYDRTTGNLETLIGPRGSEVSAYSISSSGRVGIGTATPTYGKLELSETTHGSRDLLAFSTRDGTNTPRAFVKYTTSPTEHRVDFDSTFSSGSGFADFCFLNSNVGIGTTSPARALHVSDVMRLEPRATAPSSPSAGDIFFNSTTSKLQCYDGTTWQDCF